jgi:hypothetical protein
MRRLTLLLVGVAAMAVFALSAATASAEIRFCSQTVCIGPVNGCSTPTTTGVVIQAENGDSFIGSDGTRWKCNNGKWEKTPKAARPAATGIRGPVLGIGEFYKGPKPDDPCDLSSTFRAEVNICQVIDG